MEEDYSSVKFDFVTERQEIEIGIRVNSFCSITEQLYKLPELRDKLVRSIVRRRQFTGYQPGQVPTHVPSDLI